MSAKKDTKNMQKHCSPCSACGDSGGIYRRLPHPHVGGYKVDCPFCKQEKSKNEQTRSSGLDSTPCSVVVTRYPTGIFGIAYAGATFWKTCCKEAEVHNAIASLNIPADQVKWQERYYHNGRYLISSDYRLREYIPQKK